MDRPLLNRIAQLFGVLLSALALKLSYSTASADQLRWILTPTTFLVELVSGMRFQFESHAGYLSSDRSFLIATSCAGVNFLITAFLMLSLRKLWTERSRSISWRFIPLAALFAYLATIVANTVRISTALRLRQTPLATTWLNPGQLHRVEGIVVYFGFLLLLYVVSEKLSSNSERSTQDTAGLFRRSLFPVLVYYATTLGIPLVNGAYRQGKDFWEHSLFVLLTPLLLLLPVAMFRLLRNRRIAGSSSSVASLKSDQAVRAADSHQLRPQANSVSFDF